MILRIKDVDRDVYVNDSVSGSFFITQNNTATPGNATVNTTNISGYLIFNFNPDCTYLAGTQAWVGGAANDDHYLD